MVAAMMTSTTAMAPSTGKYLESLKSSSGSLLPPRLPLLHQPQTLAPRRASIPRPRAVANFSSPPAEGEKDDEVRRQGEQQRILANDNGASTSTLKLEPMKKGPRRAQWSRGDGPGEYGGPPLDTEIRKSWGGSKRADPLTSAGPYIWKKDWQSFLGTPNSSEDAHVDSSSTATSSNPEKERDSGFLSLSRSIALDSVDVDLSSELRKPSQAVLQQQVEEARRLLRAGLNLNARPGKLRWRLAPTRREEEYWAKGRRAVTGGSEVMAREVKRAQVDPVAMAEKQRKWYAELKQNLQLVTLGIGSVGISCTYLIYSPQVAASYGAGLIGALAYIRMLGRSMDNLGATTTAGAARQALGSPRLLLPLILAMVYNRWNTLIVPEYGVMPLDLLPMLLGFFTYKAATLVEAAKDILPAKEEDPL